MKSILYILSAIIFYCSTVYANYEKDEFDVVCEGEGYTFFFKTKEECLEHTKSYIKFFNERSQSSFALEKSNDKLRLALDILNFTHSGNKQDRHIIITDGESCIFYKLLTGVGRIYNIQIGLNNVLTEHIEFISPDEDGSNRYIKLIGDRPVYFFERLPNNQYQFEIDDSANLSRVKKAWSILYSEVCTGDSSEF